MKKTQLAHIDLYLEYDVCVKTRKIHIGTEIDSITTTNVIKSINILKQINNEPISIHINTFGGCPYAALSLYDYIRGLDDVTIITIATGACMSAGTIIWSAGDIRLLRPNAVLMFHNVSSGAEGKLNPTLIDEVEECKRIFVQMCNIYEDNSKRSSKWWRDKIKYEDFYVRLDEAKRLGLIKEVGDE